MRKGSNPPPTFPKPKLKSVKKTRFYGDGGTIHGNTYIDIETRNGRVVSAWYRCQILPFKQIEVDSNRESDMLVTYLEYASPEIHGLQLIDK